MEVSTVIIDNGACVIRAGMSGYDKPSVMVPTILGRSKVPGSKHLSFSDKNLYIGTEVFEMDSQQSLDISYPIKDRQIIQINDLERIWNSIFTEHMQAKPEEHPVIITEAPGTPQNLREESIQIFLEEFGAAAYYSSCPEVLSLYSVGKTTGVVVDSGETLTDVLPIFECYPMFHVLSRIPIGGRHINNYLKRLLMQTGIEVPKGKEEEVLKDIKEKLCYVPIDMEEEQHKYEHINEIEKTYQMPSGQEVHIGAQRFRCVEPLFEPRLIQTQSEGIPQAIFGTINKCADLKQDMFKNIVLTGGTSMFPGLKERIQNDINKLASASPTTVEVLAPDYRSNAAWVGGSVLASQSAFSLMWITKEEYQENGSGIIKLKCF